MASKVRELAARNSDGISVTLSYDFSAEECIVRVISYSEDFTLYPPNHMALDCYKHPFAYATRALMRGTLQNGKVAA